MHSFDRDDPRNPNIQDKINKMLGRNPNSVWIPPQEKTTKDYTRLATIIAYTICMIWLVGFFYDEYKSIELEKIEAKAKIAKIEEHNKKVDEQSKQVITKEIKVKHKTVTLPDGTKLCTDIDEGAKTGCKIVSHEEIEKIVKQTQTIMYRDKEASSEPTGGSPPVAVATPVAPKVVEKVVTKTITVEPEVKDSKIEIDAGLVKVVMSNESSWMAIMKIMFTVLGTYLGIRLINFGFKKLEGEPKPA